MLEFSDILYGRIALPDWLGPFLRLPEFIRLRGVRLSNVDSFEFKDFSGPNRWDHGVAVAALAHRCALKAGLDAIDSTHLILASLLHDVATPPFAHTAEYVVEDFDHEIETQKILMGSTSEYSSPDLPIYQSELPAFQNACISLGKKLRIRVDPDEVARMIVGEGDLGYLVSGTIDLDNADNVTRSCLYLGIEVDRNVPLQIADWLATLRSAPTELDTRPEECVRRWLEYRSELYRLFFEASDQEAGRQAFLQHLIRRSLTTKVPREKILWNTDDGLLRLMSDLSDRTGTFSWPTLSQSVQRYRLMEETRKVAEIPIMEKDLLRALRAPRAATWIERTLSTPDLEPFVMVSARRFGGTSGSQLLPPPIGALTVFKLGGVPKYFHLPEWMRAEIHPPVEGRRLLLAIHQIIERQIIRWARERPWKAATESFTRDVVTNLNSVGDWGFRLSRNEGLHAYPGTYVHAIPSALINALGLKDSLVVDPFGGTGQTAVEVIKSGGRAISTDSSTVATLIARAKLTYLSSLNRTYATGLEADTISKATPSTAPPKELVGDWHHPKTLEELCTVKGFIDTHSDASLRQMLLSAFSAILPSTTARKGKEHGFFADNTPLGSTFREPPYQAVYEPFLQRLRKNIVIVEKLYGALEANGRDPEEELFRAKVFRADARAASPTSYAIDPESVDAIITSPPYLCMADYSLGQRLSYYWIEPKQLQEDYGTEIGPRRQRFRPEEAFSKYLADMRLVIRGMASLLRSDGYFAMVLGSPVAQAFTSMGDVHQAIDQIFADEGFCPVWSHWRSIHWHRNHGYERLRQERISIHKLVR